MRFKTIWSVPGFSLRERLIRTLNWYSQEVAALLPLRVRYWVTIQEVARATMTSPNVPDTPLHEVLKNLEEPKNLR